MLNSAYVLLGVPGSWQEEATLHQTSRVVRTLRVRV